MPLAEVLADPATVSIRPGPLSPEGAGQRVEALLDSGAEPEFAAAIHHATGGNPFLLEQLVSEVRAEGIEPTEASAERVSSLGPDTVRASVLLRLERLPSAGGPVARALAILGEHDIGIRDVATFAGVPEDAAADALAELERSGLVTGAPRVRFTHPILRAAIEDDMPAVERSRAHERAARMLADRDADAVAVAAHLLASDPGQGEWAIAALRAAARRAEALGDPAGAVRYLERAVAERPEAERARRGAVSSWGSPPPTPAIPTPPSTWSAPRRRAGTRACAPCTGRRCCTLLRDARARQPTSWSRRSPTSTKRTTRRSLCSRRWSRPDSRARRSAGGSATSLPSSRSRAVPPRPTSSASR